jgi:hypothetical protein
VVRFLQEIDFEHSLETVTNASIIRGLFSSVLFLGKEVLQGREPLDRNPVPWVPVRIRNGSSRRCRQAAQPFGEQLEFLHDPVPQQGLDVSSDIRRDRGGIIEPLVCA